MNKYPQKAKEIKDEFFIPQATLDYHLIEISHFYQIKEEFDLFINDCLKNKAQKVLVITGKGKVVRPEIEKLLKQNRFIKFFKQAGYFNGQWGAFEVTLNLKN